MTLHMLLIMREGEHLPAIVTRDLRGHAHCHPHRYLTSNDFFFFIVYDKRLLWEKRLLLWEQWLLELLRLLGFELFV